jgi:organic radical activating enzyme
MPCLWLTRDAEARAFESWLGQDVAHASWLGGYLGGILDAEGSLSHGVLRIAQDEAVNARKRLRIEHVLDSLALAYTREAAGYYLRRAGGQMWRAFILSRPAKVRLLAGTLGHHPHASRVIRSIAFTGRREDVVTLSTTLGSFIAAGYVVKNCDTRYTWDWERHDRSAETLEVAEAAVVELALRLAGAGIRNVVFTGGEPMLQQPELTVTARGLHERGFRVEIETNGTVEPSAALAEVVDQWNVSPKLASSGNPLRARQRPVALDRFVADRRAFFKFVVVSPEDVDEIVELVGQLAVDPDRVTLMPEATDPESLATRSRWLADLCRDRGYRLGTRLHVFLWGAERAR